MHKLLGRDDLIKIERLAITNLPQKLVVSNHVASLGLQLFMEFFVGKNANLNFLTGATWQNASASNILVALRGVHVQLEDELKRLIELALLGDLLEVGEHVSNIKLLAGLVNHLRHSSFSPSLSLTFLHRSIRSLAVEGLQNYSSVS